MPRRVSQRPMTLTAAINWTVLIFVVAAVAWGSRFYLDQPSPAPTIIAAPKITAPPPSLSPIELAAWRERAWEKIVPRLDEADRLSRAAIDEHLAGVDDFFVERRACVPKFAAAVMSFSGKWKYVKSKLPTAEDDAHLKFLNERFEQTIFTGTDLRKAVESAIGGYVSRVQGLEGQLLVDVRADLSEQTLSVAGAPSFGKTDEELHRRFDAALQAVAKDVARDVGVSTAQTTASFVGGEIAAQIAVRVAAAVAVRLGVSAGILGAGATTSWATFGIGLVAAVVVDVALEKAAKVAGYDPVQRVTERVNAVLDETRNMLIDGDAEAKAAYAKLTTMARDDTDWAVREECRRAAASIERSGNLGLRRELLQLHEQRAAVRRAALKRLIFTGETT